MDNLGVAMNETTLKNYALEKGMKKSYDQMTQQEKIGVAMEMFLEKTAYAAGNYAKENETLAGALGTAKSALKNFLDGSGNVDDLVGALSNAADVIIKNLTTLAPRLIGGLNEMIKKVAPMLPPLLEQLLPVVIQGAVTLINSVVDNLPMLVDIITTSVLPQLISGLWEVFSTLVGKLPEIASALVSGFGKIFTDCGTGMQVLAIAIGTVTAAVLAHTAASKLKAIAVAAGTAAEGAATVAMGIHTVATNVATAATTAFGSAMAFLTSPVTIVIAIIGALIAVIVLCVKHWDEIKEAGAKAWEGIKKAWSKAVDWFKDVWNGIKNVFSNIGSWFSDKFKKAKENATKAWSDAKAKFTKIWNGIKGVFANVGTWFKNIFNSAKNNVVNSWSSVKAKFTSIKNGIVNAFSNIKEKLTAPFTKARDIIKGIADKIKGFFEGEISMPKIKVPHFSIKPKGWKIGDLLDGVKPSLGIEWYSKAVNNPMIMKSPTVFGYNETTNSLRVGGETEDEVISGTQTLMNMIGNTVESKTSAPLNQIVSLLVALIDAVNGGNKDLLKGILAGHKIVVNGRELGRTIREYA
jgi:phage-related protein